MLSNAYFLAKFRFHTAENEPAKNLQNFANFANFANPNPRSMRRTAGAEPSSSHFLFVFTKAGLNLLRAPAEPSGRCGPRQYYPPLSRIISLQNSQLSFCKEKLGNPRMSWPHSLSLSLSLSLFPASSIPWDGEAADPSLSLSLSLS